MNSKSHRSTRPFIGLAIFTAVAGLTVFMSGQQRGQMANPQSGMHVPILTSGPQPSLEIPGVVEDWTTHHVAYTDPGTEDDAIREGRHEGWVRIVNDPRYIMQQLTRRGPAQGLAAEYVGRMNELARAQESAESADVAEVQWQDSFPLVKGRGPTRPRKPTIHRDWSMNLGSGATVGAGQYPAKYSFSTSGASCSDYVVFNTGLAGVSAGQANIVAYSNLYGTTCSTPVPSVYWAYFSGTGKALTSPVISLDGTKVAYVENPSSGAAVLRIIAWKSGQGTPAAAATPTNRYTNTTAGAGGNTPWSTCPAGQSCMISVAFQSPRGNQDAASAPFYIYAGADAIYVGDASGYLHKFTGVFNGTPGEVTTGGWPAAVSTVPLTSAVYDSASGLVFVCDNFGNTGSGDSYLYSVNSSGTSVKSKALTLHQITDGPLVDSTTEKVYVFVGRDLNGGNSSSPCGSNNACSAVYQFPYNFTSATTPAESEAGIGTVNPVYVGTFDNLYYTSEGASNTTPSGNLYWCGASRSTASAPDLVRATISTGALATGLATTVQNLTGTTSATCSTVTEILNGSSDYIFLSVTGSGSATISGANTCSGACLYSWVTTTALGSGAPAAEGLAAAGGTSGIIIDNTSSSAGASQVYFSTLGNQACGGNGSTGSGTGGCAVQASQAIPANATGTVTMITDPYIWPGGQGCTGTCTPMPTVTVGATTYTFRQTLNGSGVQVLTYGLGTASADETATAQNLAAAIMNNSSLCSTNTPAPCFANVSAANASVTATYSSNVTTLTAKTPGSAGNFTLTTNYSTGITVSGGNNGTP